MSGGSWGYLYAREEVSEYTAATLRRAAARLRTFGDAQAATMAEDVAAMIDATFRELRRIAPELRAMEWIDSGDSSPADYSRDVATWRGRL